MINSFFGTFSKSAKDSSAQIAHTHKHFSYAKSEFHGRFSKNVFIIKYEKNIENRFNFRLYT